MATVKVTKYNNLVFTWWENWQDIINAATNIGWSLSLTSGAYGAISSSASKSWWVIVNGTKYEGTNTVNIGNNTSKVLASGDTTIYHNTDGSKSFSYSFSQYFGITFSGSKIESISGSGSGTLTYIPRQATITSAPDFTDEGNPTIYYSNPAGNAVTSLDACISFTGAADNIKYRAISKTGNSYTFNLTEAERAVLRNAVTSGNTVVVWFYVKTGIGGQTYYSYVSKTLSLVNYTPTLAPVVKDVGTVSTTLTGDENKIIKSYNVINVIPNAAARKGATISNVSVTCNGITKNATGVNVTWFDYIENNIVTITATDNRGNSTTQTVTIPMINYIYLTCDNKAEITLQEGDSTKANIEVDISGNYFNGSFGVVNNSLEVFYRYKLNEEEFSNWVAVTPTPNGNSYSAKATIPDLDYRGSYTIEAYAKDRLRTIYSAQKIVKTTPIFDWGENDFNFNVPICINNKQLDYIVEQGYYDNATGGQWYYKKWNSGLAEMFGYCVANYSTSYVLSSYQQYPILLEGWISAVGTLNGFSGNLATYLPVNVKIEGFTHGCNVWVQNSNNSFTTTDKTGVSIQVIGRWK